MKNRGIYAIVDKKLEDAINLFMDNNDATALRNFETILKGNPMLSKHAEDYCLAKLAEMDFDLNVIECEKKIIVEAKELVKEEVKNA